jgi:hypothetical protein
VKYNFVKFCEILQNFCDAELILYFNKIALCNKEKDFANNTIVWQVERSQIIE